MALIGSARNGNQDLVLAKGDDRILFTGFVQGAMLEELYSNAYIYTLPSDLEGMPLGEQHQAVAHDITSTTMLYYGQLFVKI